MSLTDIRIERDLQSLLSLIRSGSRFVACRATTGWLATKLGWPEDRVDDRLARLERRGDIRRKPTPPQCSGSKWTRGRTIYLRSAATSDRGALLVANLFRAWGRKVRLRRDAACGQLRCTPSQLDEWLQLAQGRQFIEVTVDQAGVEYAERISSFPAIALPNRYCEDQWGPPERAATIEERVLAFVTSRCQASPPRPPRHEEVAAKFGGSRSHVNEVIKRLVGAGKLFPYHRGRRHFVAAERATAEAEAARPDDDIALVLMRLPMTTRELALGLHRNPDQPLPAGVRRRLRAQGVQITKLGRQYVASLGPLSEEYRRDRAQRQRAWKAEKDRSRRWCRKLGLHPGDEYLLRDSRTALQKLLFRKRQTSVAYLHLDRLERATDQFARSITDERLAAHVRAARAETGADAVSPENIAERELAQMRAEWAARESRWSPDLPGSLAG